MFTSLGPLTLSTSQQRVQKMRHRRLTLTPVTQTPTTSIQRLDEDVISIETSTSDMKLLIVLKQSGYKNGIGTDVYDIYSPRVPSTGSYLGYVGNASFVNPDCGLKTRAWKETAGS